MEVTNVVLSEYKNNNSVLAKATITLDNSLVIHGVQIINGKNGIFVSMPNTGKFVIEDEKKKYEEVVHPITKSLMLEISNEVLLTYEKKTKNKFNIKQATTNLKEL